jgi:hypothetical protein
MVIKKITLKIFFTFNHEINLFKIKKEEVKVSMVGCQNNKQRPAILYLD